MTGGARPRAPRGLVRLGILLACVAGSTADAGRSARGELLYFKAGGRIQASATVVDERVAIETPSGTHRFPVSDFAKIVPGYDPPREWSARRAEALRGDVRARLAAAWWALENGLTSESAAMIRSAREAKPDDPQAARLVRIVDRLEAPLPLPDPDVSALARALGVPLEERRGPHVLLLHQHEGSEAEARLDVLERVTRAYYLFFGFHGVELAVPKRRMVSVYLRDRDRYLAFLDAQNASAFRTTFGYYHPTFRAVVAYDLRPRRPIPKPKPDRAELLRALELQAFDLGTAAHETVHQLVAASGLDSDPRRFPLWLHEGLAAEFEVVRGGRWAGIGRAHDLRLPDWRAIADPPRLAPLLRDVGFGRGYQRDLYAASWALVDFLRRSRPDALFAFIDLLRVPDAEAETKAADAANRVVNRFRQAFGPDLPALEAEWRKATSALRTPLEEHAPGPR